MRRSEREITNQNEMVEILKACDVCHLAIQDEPYPYIIPMSYGVKSENGEVDLYFHCAKVGTKLELLKKNPHVSFVVERNVETVHRDTACSWGMLYESVIGQGKMEFVEESNKLEGLLALMGKYTDTTNLKFEPSVLERTLVMRLHIEHMTGKRRGA